MVSSAASDWPAKAPPPAVEGERAKLYAFLVGPARPRVHANRRGDKFWLPVRIPNDALLSCTRKTARMGKGKAVGSRMAGGFAVFRAAPM
jgi:hypothetical protein